MRKRSCILYYGAWVTDRALQQRKLPLSNPATSKRMERLAHVFAQPQRRCFVLSAGIMPRTASVWRWYASIGERVRGIPVFTLRQLGIKVLGYLLTPVTAICAARRIALKRTIEMVVAYCYFPDTVVFALWCKLRYGSKVILDFEDVCRPRFSDWKRSSETGPFLQLWGWVLMQIMLWVSDMILVPTEKFKAVIPSGKKVVVVRGCQKVKDEHFELSGEGVVRLLLSGGITHENGIGLLIDALKLVDRRISEEKARQSLAPRTKLVLYVCGAGRLNEMRMLAGDLRNVDVRVLGFLSNVEFSELYKTIDICLALQNPVGRHGHFKTPSKGYEAICSGKALIVSDIGDFGVLPNTVCFHLRPYTPERLAEILFQLAPENVKSVRQSARLYALKHFDIPVVRTYLLQAMKELVK